VVRTGAAVSRAMVIAGVVGGLAALLSALVLGAAWPVGNGDGGRYRMPWPHMLLDTEAGRVWDCRSGTCVEEARTDLPTGERVLTKKHEADVGGAAPTTSPAERRERLRRFVEEEAQREGADGPFDRFKRGAQGGQSP